MTSRRQTKGRLGAIRGRIGAGFLIESNSLGLIGGHSRVSAGGIVVSVATVVRDGFLVVDPRLVFASPKLGAATGVLMGAYEASGDVGVLRPSRWPVSTSAAWSDDS